MTIDGTYLTTVKRNEFTGHTTFKFKYFGTARDRNIIYVQAIIPIYTRDMPLRITGDFITKTTFNATKVEEKISDVEISETYLSNKSFFHGIGHKRAKLIVEAVGPDIFSVVNDEEKIKKLKTIKGLSNKIIDELVVSVRNTISQRQVFEFLLKYYGSALPALKIADKYKHKAFEVLQKNPYICCTEFDVPFYVADAIAIDLGFDYLDRKRIEAIIFEALRLSSANGNTFLYQKELEEKVAFIIKNSACHVKIPFTYLSSIMIKCRWLKIDKDKDEKTRIFTKPLWLCEYEAGRHINRLRADQLDLPFDDNIVSIIEKKDKIKYHKMQKEAFNLLKTTGIKILTGGPGTGKTTLLNGLIDAFEILNPKSNVVLCSPTGRAAQRMTEQTKRPASTIHKLLEIKPFEDTYTSRERVSLLNADFIIVDEFSMIDIEIMSVFLNALKSKTLILFVGDIDQLPSVGPGNVMRDLIDSKMIETYKLTNIYRQSSGSAITDNANNIIKGKKDLKFDDSFKLFRLAANEQFNDKVQEIFDNNQDFNIENTQILTTVKKDDGGTYALNNILHKKFINDEKIQSLYNFRVGDKIIVNKNNYTLNVCNGDLGYVTHIDEDGIEININDENIFIPILEVDIISLAYAITIHKSQGSEFDNVIIVLPSSPKSMLQRNLLYTAITRAKNKVFVLTKDNSFETAIEQNYIIKRNTSLKEKIMKK